MDEGTTSEIGVQCDDAISDTLEENTQRIQTRMHHIRQTMIDHYSTLVWCEHRVSTYEIMQLIYTSSFQFENYIAVQDIPTFLTTTYACTAMHCCIATESSQVSHGLH